MIPRFTKNSSTSFIPKSDISTSKARRARCSAIERCFSASARASGFPAKELERCEIEEDFLPTTVFARVGWLDIALRSNHILEQVASTNCCNEFSNQLTGGKFFRCLQDHYGLNPNNIEFFAEHGEADTEHSNIGYELVEQFATTNEIPGPSAQGAAQRSWHLVGITDGVAREAREAEEVKC